MINEENVHHNLEHFEKKRRAFRHLLQDGAPAHQQIIVRNRLWELFNHSLHVIALNHDPEWPLMSPDLIQCDFFFFRGISRA